MAERLRAYVQLLRAPFLTATAVPVLVGTAVGTRRAGQLNPVAFALCFLGVALLHLGANVLNDYFDHLTGNDELNAAPTPFSGGSRVIQDGSISPRRALMVGVLLTAAGSAVGLFLDFTSPGHVVLLLGIFGVLAGWLYSAGPLRIGYRAGGEALVGLCFGPLVVLGAAYVQAGRLLPSALAASIPVGLLIAAVLLMNEFPDQDADRAVSKRTLVVILGRRRALSLLHAIIILAYVPVLGLPLTGLIPWPVLIVAATAPLAWHAIKSSRQSLNSSHFPVASRAVMLLHLSFGLLLAVGVTLS